MTPKPDPVMQLLEMSLIGTPIPVPIEIRVQELKFDKHSNTIMIAWKCALSEPRYEGDFNNPIECSDFDEAEKGERNQYLKGEVRLDRDVFLGPREPSLKKDPIGEIRSLIAEACGRDVAEFMIAGAHYLNDSDNNQLHLNPAQREWLVVLKERGYEKPLASLPVGPLCLLEKMGLVERNTASSGPETEWRITQAGIDFEL